MTATKLTCEDVGCKCAEETHDASVATQRFDPVSHPSHYNTGMIEVIDVIEDWQLGFHRGNAVKYLARAGGKTPDPRQDLRKAVWYIERELELLAREKIDSGAEY